MINICRNILPALATAVFPSAWQRSAVATLSFTPVGGIQATDRSNLSVYLFAKWRPINYCFVSMLISPLRLIFTSKLLCFLIHVDEANRVN